MLDAMSMPFLVSRSANLVEGWAAAPLPFDPKGWMLEYRQSLRAALSQLPAAAGRTLVGRYASPDARRCDVENLLLYNVGLSAFTHVQTEGVVLLRSTTPPPPPEGASQVLVHHHRYELADAPAPSPSGTIVARLTPTPLRKPLRVENVWYDIRSSGHVEVSVGVGVGVEPLGVDVSVHRPLRGLHPGLLGMVKAVVDGFVAALHAHDGTLLDVVAERLGARLGVRKDRVAPLLMDNPAGVLGVRRLLWPFRNYVQWNPADDAIVRLQLTTKASPTWQLSGTVSALRGGGTLL